MKSHSPWGKVMEVRIKEHRVDQIFDRLEKLVKAWVSAGTSSPPTFDKAERRRGYGDPDLDAAMAELDDFLDTSKTETERREADERRAQASRQERVRQESARAEQSRRYRYSAGRGASAGGSGMDGTAAVIEDAYRYLGLSPYAPFAEVKTAYKKLLFKYHPDRNAATPDALKKATESSTRINAAYQIIEAWEESRKAG